MSAFLTRDDGISLAYAHCEGSGPTLVFLPGFMSDMSGSKALALEAHARASGWGMLRLDYSGHGQSGGRFEDGCISRWRDDVLAVIDSVITGPLLLVGSSMGGWLALLVALARPERVMAIALIAPAPDFTTWGIEVTMHASQRADLERDGYFVQPNEYGPEGYKITAGLLDDGRRNALMAAPIDLHCPIRILHGQDDADVSWQRSLDLIKKLASLDVQLMVIKDGDHRLSRPQDIALLTRIVDDLRATLSSTD
jgi:pimeloyl-ACP methyl ester carboxylesterase